MSFGTETVRPSMTAKEAADVHLLLDRFVDDPDMLGALGQDHIDALRGARRALHGSLRGAGYVLDAEGWRVADATVTAQTRIGSGRRR
jgi:hypothetical protein